MRFRCRRRPLPCRPDRSCLCSARDSQSEALFFVNGIPEGTPLKVFFGGRRAEVLAVSDGPAPGLRQVRVKLGPLLPEGETVPLGVAAGNGFTCLVDAPVAGQSGRYSPATAFTCTAAFPRGSTLTGVPE